MYDEVVVEILQASEQLKDDTLYLIKESRREIIIMQTTQLVLISFKEPS